MMKKASIIRLVASLGIAAIVFGAILPLLGTL